ncbi:MAG: hypothetical protein FWE54_06810 [Methanimicrococcus sp.]|nr:hypothetical protein [Methanimicrococcus sp.]
MAIPAFYFEARYFLLLLIPAIIIGLYFFRKAMGKKQKVLVGTRAIICVLLIIALANPVTFLTVTRTDHNPEMVLISDTTDSMSYFSRGAGQELYEYFSGRFNVKYDIISGNHTALGEKIIQYADGRNQIVLVTDGNSNFGEELDRAIGVAVQTNTTVSAVIPDLIRNDLSVEITGDKNVIRGNDQEFTVVVRQAGRSDNPVTFSYEIAKNGVIFQRSPRPITMTDTEISIPFTTNFSALGAQTLTVTINSPQDTNPVNNAFTKSVYVIEKPNVLVVTSEPTASLTQVIGTLYNVTVVANLAEFGSIANFERALNASKTVVLDNMYIGNITEEQTEALKRYVADGGGLVVVGGANSYGFMPGEGNSYLNTSFEKLLPVISIPSNWEGAQDVYLFLDVSASAEAPVPGAANNETLVSSMKATAVNIIEHDFFKEANITYFPIGSSSREDGGEFFFAGNPRELQQLLKEIEDLKTGDGATDIVSTFERANEVMDNRTGQPLVIIITDGNLLHRRTYNELLRATNSVDKYDATILFMNIYTNNSKRPGQFNDSRGRIYGQSLMRDYRGDGLYAESNRGLPIYPDFRQLFGGNNTDNDDNVTKAFLYIANPKHFIVQRLNLTGTEISGYNDVTPKAGSDKLVIASDGSPILTVWRYGLGRVASLTTDNGIGRGNFWAPDLYTAPGSKLVSSTTNWVIGDPNKESGLVIDCPDTHVGIPVTLRVQMYDAGVPVLMLNGRPLPLTMESKDVYVAELVFDRAGIYNVSGYPIVVNYPIEYKNIGVNPDLRKLVESTGGNIYTVTEAKALYISENGETATYKTKEAISFNVYLLLLALAIFLAEVIYRRMREIRELKRLHEEYDKREAEGEYMMRPDMSQFKRQNDMVADAKDDARNFLAKIKEKSGGKK